MRFEDIITKARETLTSIHTTANLADTSNNLRSNLYAKILYENIEKLNYKRPDGLLGKFKAALFEDTVEEIEAGRILLDDTYLLGNCIKCNCASCAAITSSCECKSCLYGTYAVKCDGYLRKNTSDPTVLTIDGFSDIRTEVDIKTGSAKYFGTDRSGIEKDISYCFRVDL